MDSSLWVYPWDVLDDPRSAAEIAGLGLAEVSLAAVYHTTRTLLPHNPRRRVVATGQAAAYFATDPDRYRELRLKPPRADWIDDPDSFGTAYDSLRAEALQVNAWTVVLHNSALGSRNLDLVVENAFGDLYDYALCPAQAENRSYAAALVGDLARHRHLHAIELEACGYMGWDHLSHHEKVGLRVDLLHRFLLSVCFCPACSTAIAGKGGDPEWLRRRAVAGLESFFAGESAPADDPEQVGRRLVSLLGEEPLAALVRAREGVTLELLAEIRAQLPSSDLRLILSAGPSPYETGACIGLPLPALAGAADAAMVAGFGLDDESAAVHVRRMAGHLRTMAGVRVFWPDATSAESLVARLRRLAEAGAAGFRYYQYGLCPRPNLAWIREAQRSLTKEMPHVVR